MGRSLRCCLRQLKHLTGINVTFPKHEKDKEINNYSLGKYYFIPEVQAFLILCLEIQRNNAVPFLDISTFSLSTVAFPWHPFLLKTKQLFVV